ncbi:MAG: branched-chain amino acid ABC transporter permease [Hyphomicrobiaceae bacterium]
MTGSSLRSTGLFVVVLALILVPYVLPIFLPSFWVTIVSEILIWSLLAASVNILFGYVGLLSFGQALYFGFGMYGVTIAINDFGLGLWPALICGIAAATAMAMVAGVFAVRLTWHYFAIITVVFSLIFYFAALSARSLTGGDDGRSFSPPLIAKFGAFELSLTNPTTQYYFILILVLACYGALALVLRSPLGLKFEAIRENDRRAELIGIDVYRTRLTAFIIAGAVAGLGGALFAIYGRYASASYMFYHVSGEAVVWAIVGGTGTLLGPIFGTGILIIFREIVSTWWENYLLAVGAITILVVMFAPRGLAGLLNDLINWLTRTRGASDQAAAETEVSEPATRVSAQAPASRLEGAE